MECAPHVSDKKYYAKVVFLGYFGAGKTTLYNLLTQNSIGMNTNHTTQIDYSKS